MILYTVVAVYSHVVSSINGRFKDEYLNETRFISLQNALDIIELQSIY